MYGFDNANIAKAMVNAYQRRGVQVRVSTEFDAEELSGYQTLILAGISVKLGNTGGIQHNKYLDRGQKIYCNRIDQPEGFKTTGVPECERNVGSLQ